MGFSSVALYKSEQVSDLISIVSEPQYEWSNVSSEKDRDQELGSDWIIEQQGVDRIANKYIAYCAQFFSILLEGNRGKDYTDPGLAIRSSRALTWVNK